jgi:GNAT superfamily N-acetyltransferase
MASCYGCNRGYPEDSFGTARVRRSVAECQECGTDVLLTPSHYGLAGIGWPCPQCGNYVAVDYGLHIVSPRKALNPKWNPAIHKRGERVGRNKVFLRCRTKKDFLVVRLLQVTAKAEDPRLMYVRNADQDAGLYYDTARRKYLGFIVWSVGGGNAVLRQIFIVRDERRKGLAAKLVSFWVERYADKISDTFGIEAPNEKALNLHIKLGHAIIEGESVKGLKCFFVPGM